jgi:hypothetical protein
MAYFVKIWTGATPITLSDPYTLALDQDVNDFDTCEFSLPTTVAGIRQFQRVEVVRVDDNVDILIFSGTVFSVKAGIEALSVTCRSDKAILQKKLVLADTSIVAQPANLAIGGLLLAWNSAYGESWTVDTAVTTAVTKDFSQGDTLFDAFDEIAGLCGCVWRAEGTVIKMAALLGTDRTVAGEDYAIVRFDKSDPEGSNCGDVKVETYGTLSNVVVASDGASKTVASDAGSVTANGPLAEYVRFREGSLTDQADEYLASKKGEQKVITVTVEFLGSINALPTATDRYLAKEDGEAILNEDGGQILVDQALRIPEEDPLEYVRCGDKVDLLIANCGEYLDFDGSAIVNRLTLRVENGSESVTLGLSDSYAYVNSLEKTLTQIRSQTALNSL